eukprot:6352620-Amphidinium_carterae.1
MKAYFPTSPWQHVDKQHNVINRANLLFWRFSSQLSIGKGRKHHNEESPKIGRRGIVPKLRAFLLFSGRLVRNKTGNGDRAYNKKLVVSIQPASDLHRDRTSN